MTTPGSQMAVVGVYQDVTVETARGDGKVIAMAWTGSQMTYLVVSGTELGAPQWVGESEINAAYIGTRPGTKPTVG